MVLKSSSSWLRLSVSGQNAASFFVQLLTTVHNSWPSLVLAGSMLVVVYALPGLVSYTLKDLTSATTRLRLVLYLPTVGALVLCICVETSLEMFASVDAHLQMMWIEHCNT